MKCAEEWQRQRERDWKKGQYGERKSKSGCLPKGDSLIWSLLRSGSSGTLACLSPRGSSDRLTDHSTAPHQGASKLARGPPSPVFSSWICSGLWRGWWVVWYTGGYLWDIFVHGSIFSKGSLHVFGVVRGERVALGEIQVEGFIQNKVTL